MNNLDHFKSGILPRKAAWDILLAVASGAYADVALHRTLNSYPLESHDRALVTELAYGAIRQRYFLDAWIDLLGKVSAEKQPPVLRWLLHVGLYQILKMKRIPSSAAIYTTVELAKNSSLKKLAPVVNGLLRSVLRANIAGKSLPMSKNPAVRLSQNQSLPIWLSQELINWKGEIDAQKIAVSFNKTPLIDLRVNSLRSNPINIKKKFQEVGIQSKFIDGCPCGIEVESGIGNLIELPGYKEGEWSVQDRSSQLVAPLLKVQEGDRILDACAAPGGKATHIAELVQNKCEFWAVDRSEKRLQRLKTNAERLGASCINTCHANSLNLVDLMPQWEGYFQRILLDAPCSGIGTMARHPDARWRMSPEKILELVSLQADLLEKIVPLLSKGGLIVYSTCTIHPEENHRQIENFLLKFDRFDLICQRQIWPDIDNLGDGFYSAVLRCKEK